MGKGGVRKKLGESGMSNRAGFGEKEWSGTKEVATGEESGGKRAEARVEGDPAGGKVRAEEVGGGRRRQSGSSGWARGQGR